MVEIPPEYEQVDSGSPPAPVIMRHRLRDHYEFWTTFCHSSTVLSWVRDGFPLKWTDAPPAPISLANHPSAHANADFVDEAILDLVATRTVNEVSAPPHCVLPLGVVPKPGTSKLRLIYDGQYINASLVCPAFKYETLAELPEVLQPNDFLFTIDLKSGYHHLDIHQDSWQYLGFAWKGKYYLFTQLPFGVSVACWAFTKLMRQLFRKWRSTGHRCSHYLDDSLHANQSSARLTAIQQKLILPDLEQAGFLASKPKCDLIPAQSKKYLGMMVNTALGAMLVPDAKKSQLPAAVTARPAGQAHPGSHLTAHHRPASFYVLGLRPYRPLIYPPSSCCRQPRVSAGGLHQAPWPRQSRVGLLVFLL